MKQIPDHPVIRWMERTGYPYAGKQRGGPLASPSGRGAGRSEAERAAKAERANTKSPLSQPPCGGRRLTAPPEGEPR